VFDATTNAGWAGNEIAGAEAYDTATVTPSGDINATGTVTYTLYSSGDCSGPATEAGKVTLSADGTVPKSNPQGPLEAGSYSFQAFYSGDANYASSVGACEPFVIAAIPQSGPSPVTPVPLPVTG
jgi:hypothetical protein